MSCKQWATAVRSGAQGSDIPLLLHAPSSAPRTPPCVRVIMFTVVQTEGMVAGGALPAVSGTSLRGKSKSLRRGACSSDTHPGPEVMVSPTRAAPLPCNTIFFASIMGHG